MSSYVHSNLHFNSVEKSLVQYMKDNKDFHYSLTPIFSKKFNSEMVKPFMDTIRKLSVLCVTYQYKHHYENVEKEIDEETEILFSDMNSFKKLNNPIDLIKALKSISYQIEIEQLKKVRDLEESELNSMKLLEVLPYAIALHEIIKSKAYNESKCRSI